VSVSLGTEVHRKSYDFYALCFLTGTENMKNGDYTAAFSYFQKAADRGYSKAQYNAGLCHEHGRGTPRDLSKVLSLLPCLQA
jgi:TPR repeat protein